MKSKSEIIPHGLIENRIFVIRGHKVMISVHLAELYGVETRALNQAVKRNAPRFPSDFMFQLSEHEADLVVSQSVIPHRKFFGGSLPYASTEQGVAMLLTVLRSERAIQMNIAIMSRRDGFATCLRKTQGNSLYAQRIGIENEAT